MPRTAADIVSELHTLLTTAGVPGPYNRRRELPAAGGARPGCVTAMADPPTGSEEEPASASEQDWMLAGGQPPYPVDHVHPAAHAEVAELRTAVRTTGQALLLEEVTADPEWRTRLYATAAYLLTQDDAGVDGELVVQGAKLVALARAHQCDEDEVTELIPVTRRRWLAPEPFPDSELPEAQPGGGPSGV